MTRKIFVGFILTVSSFLFFSFAPKIYAKRILPQAQPSKVSPAKAVSKGVTVSVKFRNDRNAIIATFTNLKIAKEVGYTLTYKNGENIEQVAQSSVDVNVSPPAIRELLFGTCSTNNVCQYDTGIHDAKFVVTTTLTTGRKVIKTFNLKVKK